MRLAGCAYPFEWGKYPNDQITKSCSLKGFSPVNVIGNAGNGSPATPGAVATKSTERVLAVPGGGQTVTELAEKTLPRGVHETGSEFPKISIVTPSFNQAAFL